MARHAGGVCGASCHARSRNPAGSGAGLSRIEIVPFDAARFDELFVLLSEVRGLDQRLDEFEWWFDGNPVGPRTIFVAQSNGRLVGVLCASFYRAIVDGKETLVALPLWAGTDPAFRGRGIFQGLNRAVERVAREEGATLELGFTNREAGPIYISRLRWRDIRRLRLWARVLQPLNVMRGLGGRADGTFDVAFAGPAELGREHERAYRRLAPALPSHFVRDAAYLRWRYAHAPRAYTVLTSTNGYAVVGARRQKGLNASFIADLVTPPDALRETRALLRSCLRAARGADVMLALLPSTSAQRRAFVSLGFAPTPLTIRLIGTALEGDLPLDWHFTLGDTDYF